MKRSQVLLAVLVLGISPLFLNCGGGGSSTSGGSTGNADYVLSNTTCIYAEYYPDVSICGILDVGVTDNQDGTKSFSYAYNSTKWEIPWYVTVFHWDLFTAKMTDVANGKKLTVNGTFRNTTSWGGSVISDYNYLWVDITFDEATETFTPATGQTRTIISF